MCFSVKLHTDTERGQGLVHLCRVCFNQAVFISSLHPQASLSAWRSSVNTCWWPGRREERGQQRTEPERRDVSRTAFALLTSLLSDSPSGKIKGPGGWLLPSLLTSVCAHVLLMKGLYRCEPVAVSGSCHKVVVLYGAPCLSFQHSGELIALYSWPGLQSKTLSKKKKSSVSYKEVLCASLSPGAKRPHTT